MINVFTGWLTDGVDRKVNLISHEGVHLVYRLWHWTTNMTVRMTISCWEYKIDTWSWQFLAVLTKTQKDHSRFEIQYPKYLDIKFRISNFRYWNLRFEIQYLKQPIKSKLLNLEMIMANTMSFNIIPYRTN
jgi:hypothetical protein